MVLQCQNKVLRAKEIVDYSSIVRSSYPPFAIQTEPFIGIKMLCKDTQAFRTYPAQRIAQLDGFLSTPNMAFGDVPLAGTGCCLRETKYSSMQDGFWVITLPVPRSCLHQQMTNFINTLTMFKQIHGIVPLGYVEINVSGRCGPTDIERCLGSLHMPDQYMKYAEVPDSAWRIGTVTRINDNFICLRTRWKLNPQSTTLYDDISVIAQIICSIYR